MYKIKIQKVKWYIEVIGINLMPLSFWFLVPFLSVEGSFCEPMNL